MNELMDWLYSRESMQPLLQALLDGRAPGENAFRAMDGLDDADTGALVSLLLAAIAEPPAAAVLAATLARLGSQGRTVDAVVSEGLRFVATQAPSPARSAMLDYLRGPGRRSARYEKLVKQECNEANYAARSALSAEGERPPGKARDWESWEREGWGGFETDWPIADLYFALGDTEHFHRLLRTVRSPLIPVRHRLHYFLLDRVWRSGETSLPLLDALGRLARLSVDNPDLAELHDRAVLVFRNHWAMLPMGELVELAEEAQGEPPGVRT